MRKVTQHTTINIYEQPGVFGDEAKFQHATDRLKKILSLIDQLDLKKGKILDVGCGTGYLAAELKERYPKLELYGCDISKTAIRAGKRSYPHVRLQVADAEEKLPYQNNFFDLVISGEHIAHLKNTDIYLEELHRVLKKNGLLLLSTPNLTSWLNRGLLLLGKAPFFAEPLLASSIPIVTIGSRSFPDPSLPPSGHLRLFGLDMLIKTLAHYHFKVEKQYGVSALSMPGIKQVDRLLALVPSLASGLIVIARKIK